MGPLANNDVWAELSGVFDKLIIHLCLLYEDAAVLVDEVEVEGAVGIVGAVVVVVKLVVDEVVAAVVVVVLLVWWKTLVVVEGEKAIVGIFPRNNPGFGGYDGIHCSF